MKEFINDYITLLVNKGIFKSVQKLVYKGHIPSLNDLYGSRHWSARHKDAQKFHLLFQALMKKNFKKPNKKEQNKFSIFIYFNSRHDTDNIIGIEKYFTDMLVREGYVQKDNKSFFRSLLIAPDETLAKNTVVFLLALHN